MKKTLFNSFVIGAFITGAAYGQTNFKIGEPASKGLIKRQDAFVPNPALQRTISLDSGYLSAFNSNRAIGEFDLELRQAWGGLYDWAYNKWQPTTVFGRTILYGLFNAATWGPGLAQMATYHELGHSSRYRSIGIDTSFINVGKAVLNMYEKGADNIRIEDVLSDGYFPTMFGVTAISALIPFAPMFSAVMFRPDKERLFIPKNERDYYYPHKLNRFGELLKGEFSDKKYDSKKDKDTVELVKDIDEIFRPGTALLTDAGGLNNQVDQCRRVENNLWYQGGDHFSTVGTYFWDKTWAGFQSLSSQDKGYTDNQDTSLICIAYRRMEIDLTHEEIISYSYLSYILSSQTYANIYQIYNTIVYGDNKVYAPEFYNIKLPNFGLYFTTEGPTYNVSSGYRVNDTLFIPVSVEFGLKKSAWELSVGVRKKFPSFHDSFIHAEVVFNVNNSNLGGSVYGGLVWDKLWSVRGGFTYHNAKTFQGERNIPSYKNGDTDIEAWLSLGVVY
ncbi:MAG: hypothetical protein H6492_02510 [Candidatus Paracaedibacteraceae bacterium]|nr:hypothetical protein [Candidatus Paracaedibacteraceae bacterium]